MNILYIGHGVSTISGGADVVNKRNYDLLREIYGENVFSHFLYTNKSSLFDKVKGYYAGFCKGDEKKILEIIEKEKIDIMFVGQSFLGKICNKIKKNYPNVNIVLFFHNIEKNFASESLKIYGFRKLPFYWLASYHELLAVKYSDYYITLNSRDSKLLNQFYNVKASLNLPVSYQDILSDKETSLTNNLDYYLFVGTDFFGNITGIEFFLKEVMPSVNINLVIIGKGMEKYKEKWQENNRVKVYGFVSDLSIFYQNAKLVITPIFFGGGMKTKVAEALMYGKNVIGTQEAFEGYEFDESFMYKCSSKFDFIAVINKVESTDDYKKFNIQARKCFLENYESSKIKDRLNIFLDNISC